MDEHERLRPVKTTEDLCRRYDVNNFEESLSTDEILALDFINNALEYSELPDFENLVMIAVSNSTSAADLFLRNSNMEPFIGMAKIKDALAAAGRTMIRNISTTDDDTYIWETALMHRESIERHEESLALLKQTNSPQVEIERTEALIRITNDEFEIAIKRLATQFKDFEFAIDFIAEPDEYAEMKYYDALKAIAEKRIIEELRNDPDYAMNFLEGEFDYASKMTRFEEAKKIAEETCKKNP